MIDLTSMAKELENLKRRYALTLTEIMDRAEAARSKVAGDAGPVSGRVSSHDAFNMAANCATLSELAGKIEQTENVLRWMQEAK